MELQLQEIREYQKQYGINSLWAGENTFHAVITCYPLRLDFPRCLPWVKDNSITVVV